MRKLWMRFLEDRDGATAIEYGLIAAVLSLAIVSAAGVFGSAMNENFNCLSSTIDAQTDLGCQ